MKINRKTLIGVAIALVLAVCLGGCKKKTVAAPPPPPPPPPAAPTASISASPDTVQSGQSVQLTWQTQNATSATISDLGTVDVNGNRTVNPTQSTTYRLQAMGPGGTQEATARVTVNMPPPPPPPPPPPAPSVSDEQLLQQNVQDVFFDYDSYEVRQGDQQKLAAAATYLNTQKPNWKLQIEGYCDERGSTEYNLALGDNRANAVQQALVRLGVSADRLKTISYGKEKPFCTEQTEDCYQQNRRDHFSFQK